ncbi:hypothetical protein [Nocardioides sp.]|uniref:hypothetical protein n=1 Tax=Nocardioides sp. TaxID=35761 RepID=UPI0039E65D73
MKLLSRVVLAAAVSLGLASATLVLGSQASAAGVSTVSQADKSGDLLAKKKGKKGGIKLSASADGYHAGGTKVVTVTAKVKGVKKGKVKFSIGTVKGKAKIKKGKATWDVPLGLPAGTYEIKAKSGKKKGSLAFSVWASKLDITPTTFTVQKDLYPQVKLTGSVEWKGAPAQPGSYVDFYQDMNPDGGYDSPLRVSSFASIDDGGTFSYDARGFETYFETKGLPSGTYTFGAFYTGDSGFDDYIYSVPLTVTWNATAAE